MIVKNYFWRKITLIVILDIWFGKKINSWNFEDTYRGVIRKCESFGLAKFVLKTFQLRILVGNLRYLNLFEGIFMEARESNRSLNAQHLCKKFQI